MSGAGQTSETKANGQGAAEQFRRRVFYIPGYDPFHPRRYRELYRKEGADQARLSGYELKLTPLSGTGSYSWRSESVIEGRQTRAEISVLVWSDIVKRSMSETIPATYLQLLRTAWAYIGSGALFRLMRLRKGPMIAALYPIVFLLLQLALAVGLAWGIGAVLAHFSHWSFGIAAAAVTLWAVLRWFRAKDNKAFAWYLMHDYAFSAQNGGANPPELEARMAEFRAQISAALAQDCDEVLVVGHSSGAHLAISILADLLRVAGPQGLPTRPRLSFLSLGQVVPMVSFLPKAQRLRRDLRDLSTASQITWVDVTAPGDGCAFALCDPVAVSGMAPEGKLWPLVLSAAFSQTLSSAKQAELKRRYFRLHFQYLCAFDALPGTQGDYDYFAVTAGPLTLAERFRSRAPSKSRIETPVNLYRSTT
ncbi:hypothetical protein Q9295_01550 [Xinfangfangia sp. CPCC 101601]|uniref:Alpha/beta hydrolase n=1 Tax=Pseudogemmobacter lacusdianii TaxID=3069608 RepID=A0ABU0VTI7_9RHOB|nr:hypothetical protein [Xinfangfangia sp. CPCC 101601]MDQ2065044.1 hypothetical protein [Xinfangfangia sp. CPCC 101601]